MTDATGTVYIIQESPGKNFTGALEYGRLEVLLPENRSIAFSAGATVGELRRRLSRFSDADRLLLVGDPVAIGVSCVIAAEANQGRVKMLKWDRQEQRYIPVSFNLYKRRRDESGD